MIRDSSKIDLKREIRQSHTSDRKTQSGTFYKHYEGNRKNSIRYFSGTSFKISGNIVGIEDNKNVESSSVLVYGVQSKDEYSPYDDNSLDTKDTVASFQETKAVFTEDIFTNEEYGNGIIDVTRRNFKVTKTVDTQKNYDFISISMNGDSKNKENLSDLIDFRYEDHDSGDSFFDTQKNLDKTDSTLALSIKNSYNAGDINPYTDKSYKYSNSITNEEKSSNQYTDSYRAFASTGFTYNSGTPDSIAFGGLKR